MNKSEKQYKDEIIDKNSIFDELLAQDDKTHLFAVRISNQGAVIEAGELCHNIHDLQRSGGLQDL